MKQFIYLIFFALLIGNCLTSIPAFGKTYTGRLLKSNGRYHLIKSGNKLELSVSDLFSEATLQRLKNDDFVSLEGTLTTTNNRNRYIAVKEINYVGLNELMGFWMDQFGYCHYFSSFTSLKTFWPSSRIPCSSKSISKMNHAPNLAIYNYLTNVTGDDSWNLLVSSKQEQYLGELSRTANQQMILTYYFAVDGSFISEHFLNKID